MFRRISEISLKLVGVIFILQVTQVSAANDLIKDMVRLDQVYIPVLAFTSEEKVKQSRSAMALLIPVWSKFKSRYQNDTHGDEQWSKDFDKVDGYIRGAGRIVTSGHNLKDAHEELEQIRIVFMRLRERNDIQYYIDHLTRFHEPMEEIVLAAKGKTEKTLSNESLETIQNTLPTAKQFWRVTSAGKFDALLYEFDEKQQAELQSLVEKERQALDRLERALEKGNKQDIINAAVGIKPNFAKIFKSFGHFPTR